MSDEMIPSSLKYTKEHEWAQLGADGKTVTIGITHHAQESLGEVVFLDLPAEGRSLKSGETLGVVESIKAVSDIYSPVAGKVVESNKPLVQDPGRINSAPYQEGWLVKIELADSSEWNRLMSADEYKALVASLR